MAGVYVKQNSAALTADGTADGWATVADNSLFPVGSKVTISSSVGSALCQVAQLSGSTLVGLRIISEDGRINYPQYGVKSDMSGFLLADSATLHIEPQIVDEYNQYKLL